MEKYTSALKNRDIHPTAIRLLIYKVMLNFSQAFSLSDLENVLDSVDKSTLYRTITLFHQKQLIHSIDDGSGSMKYSLCSNNCSCSVQDLHTHFHCKKCEKTVCLTNISIPRIELPQGFKGESANFVIKGICNSCNKFAT